MLDGCREHKLVYPSDRDEPTLLSRFISCTFDRAEPFQDGRALVEKDGKLRYIDHDGTIMWEEK